MSAPTRTRRTSPTTTGRFSRPGAAGRSATTTRRGIPSRRRPVSTQRRAVAGGWLQRRKPQKQSGLKRVMGGVTGALPGLAKKGSGSSSKGRTGKAGGLALLAGVAGLAFKNRDKVASMARRDDAGNDVETATPTPVAPVDTSPASPGTTGLNTGMGSTATGTSPKDDSAGDPRQS